MFDNIADFIAHIKTLDNISDAYDVFESMCTDDLRDSIYASVPRGVNEPFRYAMHTLGFTDY